MSQRVGIRETFGLSPLSRRARETWLALRGDINTPSARFFATIHLTFVSAMTRKKRSVVS